MHNYITTYITKDRATNNNERESNTTARHNKRKANIHTDKKTQTKRTTYRHNETQNETNTELHKDITTYTTHKTKSITPEITT